MNIQTTQRSLLLFLGSILFVVLAIASKCAHTDLKTADVYDKELAEDNYVKYCAGCHGMYMERFSNTDREKLFSMPTTEMVKIIRDGDESTGMPSFKETFTTQEIDHLAKYILVDIREKSKDHDYGSNLSPVQKTEKLSFRVDTVIKGLNVPWGMTWLPNGDMLVTERSGQLFRFRNGVLVSQISGLPPIYVQGQGGLLDIRLHPDYEKNGWIYLAYSTYGAAGTSGGGNTAIMRARLRDNQLVDKEEIFKATPDSKSGVHFGCRMVFGNDGLLYFSVGERGSMNNAQLLTNHSGKIHRITDSGKIPADNPFISTIGAMPTIFTYGNRNPQGLAKHPQTGVIWSTEHGPRGGDELNIVRKGLNYGWPVISFGINYDGTILTPDTAKAGMEQPVHYWTPSIAPCGMTFVSGGLYPGWENNILSGSLSFVHLMRTEIEGNKAVHHEKLLKGVGRVRNVDVGPDGLIYVAVETPGVIIRLIPVK